MNVDDRMRRRYGDSVQPWLDDLPNLLDRVAATWDLTLGEVFADGNSGVTMRVTRGGSPLVLKVSPDAEVLAAQVRVLRLYRPSAPEIIADTEGAVLMEHINGVARWPDLHQFAALLRDLHSVPNPADHARAVLLDDIPGFFARFPPNGPVTAEHLHRSRELTEELVATRPAPVLLHGDLHRDNLLDAGPRGVVAIDPQGLLGEAEFDAVDYVLAQSDVRVRLADLVSVTSLSSRRLARWCLAMAPLIAIGQLRTGRPIDHLTGILADLRGGPEPGTWW
ncbi:aminoglycoside phosphotransferase family protein [Actinokineospora globicatena]|uniref:aminoglycoside phosphotransferase family protein n=1 Tax=Actinokineospora globicatena TaxID=103729 RepID=UPI0020A556BC|nr:aminoglycoside phosphotransferase family protein [Actinokineospora globicatena]